MKISNCYVQQYGGIIRLVACKQPNVVACKQPNVKNTYYSNPSLYTEFKKIDTTKKKCLIRDAKERNYQEGGDSVFPWAGRKRG